MKKETRKYLLYAFGEITLIVIGILLALFINNRNINANYKSQIDNNLVRVHKEIEKNIDLSRKSIRQLRTTDSLIHLVMSDSLTPESYYENLGLTSLILNNQDNHLEQQAYNNLIELNISQANYQEALISDLKELYAIIDEIIIDDKKTSDFITETSIPLLIKNVKSFGDLAYKNELKDEVVNYFLNDDEYKSYVVQYSIFAIRIQLSNNRNFYKKALDIYQKLSENYNLKNQHLFKFNEVTGLKYEGMYTGERLELEEMVIDTIALKLKNDSLFIISDDQNIPLFPIVENQYFLDVGDNQQVVQFVTFYEEENESTDYNMRVHILSHNQIFKKQRKLDE